MSIKSKPLFQNKMLDRHLAQLRRKKVLPPSQLIDAIEIWRSKFNRGFFQMYGESQIEQAFNNSIFGDILGYKSMSSAESIHHFLPKPAATSRDFPDFVLGAFDPSMDRERWRAVGEIKGHGVNLDLPQASRPSRETPVEQAFRYAVVRPGVEWVVVTNVREIRLYRNGYEGAWHTWLLEELSQQDKFYEFWALLRQPSLCPEYGVSDTMRLYESSVSAGEALTEGFYGLYDEARSTLLKELRAQPACEGLTELAIQGKSHKLLNRILFAAFCEDHVAELLPRKTLHRLYTEARLAEGEHKFWNHYKRFFRELDKGSPPGSPYAFHAFNGGLFAPDPVLDNLNLPNHLFTKRLRYRSKRGSTSREIPGIFGFYEYDFAEELDVDALGAIFEQSLKDIVSQAAVRGAGEVETSEREKGGVYYTPSCITGLLTSRALTLTMTDLKAKHASDPVVRTRAKKGGRSLSREETAQLQRLMREAKLLEGISLQDPACGSGAFLVEAYHQLWVEYNSLNVAIGQLAGAEPLFGLDSLILRSNLHGSDLLHESTEITKLSLWLRTASKTQPLEKLESTILTLDSLRDDRAEVYDIVVSNPPWGADLAGWTNQEIDKMYPDAGSERDSYALFTMLSYRLLKKGGILAFIIPNSWLTTAGYAQFRKWMLSHFELLEIIHVWKVFVDVNHDACMLVARKRSSPGAPSEDQVAIVRRVPRGLSEQAKWQRIAEENWEETFEAKPYLWSQEPGQRFETIYAPAVAKAIDEAFSSSSRLGDVADVTVGIQVYHNSKVSKADIKKRVFHSKLKSGKDWYPFITGNEVQRYYEDRSNGEFLLYGEGLRDKRPLEHYGEPRILIQQIFWNRLAASLSADSAGPILYLNSLFSISNIKAPYTLLSLLAVLNSRIYSACYERFANRLFGDKFPKISKMDLARLPLPALCDDDLRLLEEASTSLTELWISLRHSLLNFREDCKALNPNGDLWSQMGKFWILDRSSVFDIFSKHCRPEVLSSRSDFVSKWHAAREAVQTSWARIMEQEEKVEEAVRGGLEFPSDIYKELLARVPPPKIEDALLAAS